MAPPPISFATLNLRNLQRPPGNFYGTVYTDAQYRAKLEWTARIIAEARPDVIGFQELWDPQGLDDLFARPEITVDYELRAGEDNRGLRNALAARDGLDIVWSQSFPGFPDALTRFRSTDEQIDLRIGRFSRPVLRATVRPEGDGGTQPEDITVFVAHLKSKRPSTPEFPGGQQVRPADRNAVGEAISAIRRNAEAAALRVLVSNSMEPEPDRPTVVLGDLNDAQLAVPLAVVTAQPRYRLFADSLVGRASRYGLYAAATLQEYRSLRDVYYTHIFEGIRESLDHVLVSQHFYDYSANRQWSFHDMRVYNDHLEDEDEELRVSDHALVKATFDYNPAD